MIERQPIDHSNVYDAHPDGWGEIPAKGTPVETDLQSDVARPDDLRTQVGRFGHLRDSIKVHTDRDKAVGLQFAGPRQIRMFVADHRDSIKKVAVASIAAGVTAGVVYLHEQQKKSKK